MDSTTMIRTAGAFGSQCCSARMSSTPANPTAAAAATASPRARPRRKPPISRMRPSALMLKPNSLGSCPTRMVSARPFR